MSGFGCDQDNISTNVIPFPEYFYSGDRSSFIGAGSILIPLQLGYKLPLEDLWTRVGMRSLDWTGTVGITYGYQPAPTPEGSSLSLTLFGLGILFATTRGRL